MCQILAVFQLPYIRDLMNRLMGWGHEVSLGGVDEM